MDDEPPTPSGRTGEFAGGVEPWLTRLDSLRNTVRQELVRRRLAALDLPLGGTALDVGAGQGTQAIALARRGWRVVALEPDPDMRAACRDALARLPDDVAGRVEVRAGRLDDLDDPPDRHHDLVTCHGVFMYLDDPRGAVSRLTPRVAPGGVLSIVARNAAAVPVRPLLRGDWRGVLAALDELDRATEKRERPWYRNELGVDARADDVDRVIAWIDATGDWSHDWTGVRLASDGLPVDRPPADEHEELETLVDLEERLGQDGRYRRLASLFHLVSRRRDSQAALTDPA